MFRLNSKSIRAYQWIEELHQLGRKCLHGIAFGLGAGLLPKMPGTWGTCVAIPFYILMIHHLTTPYYFLLLSLLTGLAIVISQITSDHLGVHDAPCIVIDEMVGFWWTMGLLPTSWFYIVLGFLGFRCFDILKPWPVGWIDQNVKGGVGIVLDDVVAGLMAFGALYLGFFVANHI